MDLKPPYIIALTAEGGTLAVDLAVSSLAANGMALSLAPQAVMLNLKMLPIISVMRFWQAIR